MTDPAVTQLLLLLDESFDGNEEHSLLANLRHVDANTWFGVPPSGGRTIRQITDHAGVGIRLYGSHLFGAANLDFAALEHTSPGRADPATMPAVRDWLIAAHREFRTGVGGLSDANLTKKSRAHFGVEAETRWLVGTVIQHNIYHAGEINHLRALLAGDDRWPSAPGAAR